MKRKVIVWMLCILAVAGMLFAAPAFAADEGQTYTTVATADDLLAALESSYAYVQLSADMDVELSGQELVVDLAGYDLNVSGSGKVKAFDTANDTFDHTLCGTLTCDVGVTCATTFTAPTEDAFFYVGYGGSGRYTFHRMDMKITNVVFRPSVAGVYYKAYFACDRLMEESVKCYGVAARVGNVIPGRNFRDYDKTYTENTGLISGTSVNSGIVSNILQDLGGDVTANTNKEYADTTINARLYIELDGQGIVMAPNYASNSLSGLLTKLDDQYDSMKSVDQNQLDDFTSKWKNSVAGWNYTNLGKNAALNFDAMNADLVFEEGTTKAMCYKCDKVVTWTAVSDESTLSAPKGTNHYYLAEDLEYTGSSSTFISTGESGAVSCLHLNGNNITATNASVFWVGSGKMYVMGQGTVTGKSSKSDTGAAVSGNNRNASNGIYLYGGTYTKSADSTSSASIISMGASARNYNIYKDAIINGGTGTAIYVDGSSSSRNNEGYLGLFGCTVNGNVKMLDFGTFANNVSVVDATINGTLNVPAGHNVYLQGAPTIKNLSVADGTTVITKGLKAGANIGVTATGYFTKANSNLGDYTGYFTATDKSCGVFVRDNTLYCGKDYVSDLNVTITQKTEMVTDPETSEETEVTVEVHTAYCPACEDDVTWTVLTQAVIDAHAGGDDYFYDLNGDPTAGDTHYYLGEDLTYTGSVTYSFLHLPGSGKETCLHMNGHNITSTKRSVIYTNSGTLNVMGTGTLAGTGKSSSYGAAVQANNKSAVFNFYSGTYAATAYHPTASATIRCGGNGARFYFYEDAVIEGAELANAIYLSTNPASNSVLNLKGTTVNGNIAANGKGTGKSWTLIFDDATVNGTLTAKDSNAITLINNVKIDLLDASAASMIDLTDGTTDGESIGSGAFVTVQNAGAFAYAFDGAADYVNCFRTAWRDDKIVIRDNALTYKPNYEMGLQYNSEGKARCPICQDYYTWTAITDAASITEAGHYYLSGDLSFVEATDAVAHLVSSADVCLHLNGYDVTAAQSPAIGITDGVLNVMGDGTVLGNSAVFADSASADSVVNLYGGAFRKTAGQTNAVLTLANSGNINVCEDADVNSEGTGLVVNAPAGTITLDSAKLTGDVAISDQSTFMSNHGTFVGTVTVTGGKDVTFSGKTVINLLDVQEGIRVNFDNLLSGSAIKVNATGTFTSELAKARTWVSYFEIANNTADQWIIPRDGALFIGNKVDLVTGAIASDDDRDALDNAYGDLVVKYGEMHNHTSAGLTADGRKTLAEWKERMVQLNMSFATIVDHKQVAHMYHKDWQTEPTEDYPVVFVGGSEPQTGVTELNKATQGNMHYNMITGDPQKLVDLVVQMETLTGKNFYSEGAPYSEANWGANGTNNKNKDFVWSDYNEPDGMLDRIFYADWTKTEFDTMVKNFYDAGSLIVEVHPDYPSYIKSEDPLDYCFAGDAGSATSAAMGFEIHTGNYGYMPSKIYNEQAYQLWLDMLEAGKKVYATYGDDGHRLPTAVALTTAYAPDGANAAYYMQLMHDGNFAPGWVGIRMIVGDTQMGGTADSFDGQRLVFSIGDMYQANDYSRLYLDKSQKVQTMDWEPGYDPTCTYTVRLYDDSGLLQESVVNPGDDEMDYFAIDADADAKFYRVEVLVEKQNDDGSIAYRYRCGVGNPIWNAAAYATTETAE